ncbi:hypothetical protein AAG570_008603 [Ranatra chinensis]|uniref:Uncharacterized protein n=1 Tax=Ranatra chinensis TaxID=642074 RepID=A0ABD0YRD5_9HEMI
MRSESVVAAVSHALDKEWATRVEYIGPILIYTVVLEDGFNKVCPDVSLICLRVAGKAERRVACKPSGSESSAPYIPSGACDGQEEGEEEDDLSRKQKACEEDDHNNKTSEDELTSRRSYVGRGGEHDPGISGIRGYTPGAPSFSRQPILSAASLEKKRS